MSTADGYRRVIYRDVSGTTHEAKWPNEIKPTPRAIFRGGTYELAGVSDGVVYYSQQTRKKGEGT